MKSIKPVLLLLVLILGGNTSAQQNILVEGFTLEQKNKGEIRNVSIKILKKGSAELVRETKSDKTGYWSLELPGGEDFEIVAQKKSFFEKSQVLTTKGQQPGAKVTMELKLERKPGYVFDVTLTRGSTSGQAEVLEGIEGALIEVFNNTTHTQELRLENYPVSSFKFYFEKGNHYTIMVRRDSFFSKRIEAYVDIEDCILCFDGLGKITPNVTDVLTDGNVMGTFLSDVMMDPIILNKTYRIENIYYDYNQWFIRSDAAKELDNLVNVLKDNPRLIVELGSHTDSRGGDTYNLELSEKRAKAAVEYIIEEGGISAERISYKGYGESQLVNRCKNGIQCSDKQHERNRRTEFKVVGLAAQDPLKDRTLQQIIEEEKQKQ